MSEKETRCVASQEPITRSLATSMRSCHRIFTDQFIFRMVLARILNIFLNSSNQSANPTDLKRIFFAFFIAFSFPF